MSEASSGRNYRNIDEIIFNGVHASKSVLGSADPGLEGLYSWLDENGGAAWPNNYDLAFQSWGEGNFPFLLP